MYSSGCLGNAAGIICLLSINGSKSWNYSEMNNGIIIFEDFNILLANNLTGCSTHALMSFYKQDKQFQFTNFYWDNINLRYTDQNNKTVATGLMYIDGSWRMLVAWVQKSVKSTAKKLVSY